MSTNTHSIDLEADSSQYLTVADSVSLSITGDMSVEAWIKLESNPADGDGYEVVSKHNTTGDQRSYDMIIRNNGGSLRCEVLLSSDGTSTNQVQHNSDTMTLNNGTWYHIAFTVNFTSNEFKFYLDGSQHGTTQTESTINAIFNSTATVEIGRHAQFSSHFDGLIDEVRIWSDERTSTEISDSKSIELVGNEANLAAYWKLNNDLEDATANNNDLTNPASASFSTDVPFTGATSGSFLLF